LSSGGFSMTLLGFKGSSGKLVFDFEKTTWHTSWMIPNAFGRPLNGSWSAK